VEGDRSAFGASSADAYLVDARGVEELRGAAKDEIARRLLDWVEARLAGLGAEID
jgi:hypothetical protein